MTLKPIVGYCDPLWAAPGETIQFMVSARSEVPYTAQLVRLICGDDRPEGAGYKDVAIESALNGTYTGRQQHLIPGSYGFIPPHPALSDLRAFTVQAAVWPTYLQAGRQVVLSSFRPAQNDGFVVLIDASGCLTVQLGNGTGSQSFALSAPLPERLWSWITVSVDVETAIACLAAMPLSAGPWQDESRAGICQVFQLPAACYRPANGGLFIAAMASGPAAADRQAHFNGKIDALRLFEAALPAAACRTSSPEHRDEDRAGAVLAEWDFGRDMAGERIWDISGNDLNGKLYNLPTRAVTGYNWDGSEHNWRHCPEQYGAIHFHDDDLYDAGWQADFSLTIPDDLVSGQYAVRLLQEPEAESDLGPQQDRNRDDIVFFVRPKLGRATARIAYLVPTATYLAYANTRLRLQPSPLFGDGQSPYANDHHLKADTAIGGSLYERHRDRSGVHFSSWLRPVMNLKPFNRLWSFNADTNVTDWLAQFGEAVDYVTDHDLHKEGVDLLRPYQVVITGTHPEYYSTAMRSGMEQYLAGGGRLMYLGGNGFYWRIGFSDAWPAAIEVRRAEDGTRAWIAEPGEYYQAFTGEYGGLWRRIGKPPNTLVGIGFAAQGFDRGTHYERSPAADDERVRFMFDGIDDAILGDFGSVVGGASGEEIDRYDVRLGSPAHALVVASARNHSEQMLRTKEEFLSTALPFKDRSVRSDLVFFECSQGGAVFATGSISWASALAHENYQNNICKLTENVLRRFLDPTPFPMPKEGFES